MRKGIVLLVLFVLLQTTAGARADDLELNARYQAAVVMDVASGNVLYGENAHTKAIPASLVKMMVFLVTMEKLSEGAITLTDQYTVSADASRIGGHQVYLKQGEVFQLKDLMKAAIVGSANDAAFAIAEHVAGSQSAFVELMNQRARELGMKDTIFRNVHGLPPNRRKGQKENYTTAYDLGLLARELTKYPFVMKWASTRLDSFRDGTFQLLNTNHQFLRKVEGSDGLKTGYHPRGAGFSMVGTAVRQGRRLVAIVLGAKTPRERLRAASRLLDLAFADQLP